MLKELYHGEISPSEKKPGHADSCTQEWMKLSAEFEKTLTPEQVQKYEGVFHQPEAFMKMGHGIMAVPLPDEMISKSGKASEKAVGRAEKEEKTAGHREKSRKVADHDSR